MPQTVAIDLPLIISPRGGLTLVRPIGLPDLALASANPTTAARAVRRHVLKRCRRLVGKDLLNAVIRGAPEIESIRVEFKAEKRSSAWRDPVQVKFDAVRWQQGDAITIAFIPALDLTVVATPQTDLEKLVEEQIRSSIRRGHAWSLSGLARLPATSGALLRSQRIEIRTPTPAEHAREQQEEPVSKTPTLRSIATRLDRRSLRPAHHREDEVKQLARLLAADPLRSVLLVGPSGVGKTAVFHEWVCRRAELGDRSTASIACWSTDGSRLISGQSGFGMWQQQCLQMCEEAKRYRSVVHLGNLVELSESGRLHGSGGCGALLAPRLAGGSLQAVIECTPEQMARIERIEPRLVRALTVLRIEEPTPEQTRSILLEAAAGWQPRDITAELRRKRKRKRSRSRQPHRSPDPPVVEPEALQTLDRLHRRFRTDAAAPGRPLSFFHTVMSELEPGQPLDSQKVIGTFGRQTGLPGFLIDDSVRPDLESIRRELASQVIGQDAIIEVLIDVIATLAADLSRGDRPLASMLLIGPTGVGKTETAKALARLIYSDVSRLVRIDMSELSTPAAVGRLVGDAMHPEGLLTAAVRAEPFSLVLLDEFEKAHSSVYDLLLQVLGEGRLTDGRGRLADFRNAIVLMTSNLGVDTFRAAPLGLADTQTRERRHSHFQRQVRDFLRPEMFNRIDRILTYDSLEPSTVERIAQLRLDEVRRRDGWQSQGDRFDVDAAAISALTRNGFQPQYGARPLTREIERSVVVPLSEAICQSGRLTKLDADVTAGQSERPDQISVRVSSDPSRIKKPYDTSAVALIEEMTTLRRRGQTFDRCDAVRKFRNQYTMTTRKLKSRLRAANSNDKKDKIRYGQLGAHQMQLREQLAAIRQLCNDINRVEADLCASYYRGEAIDSRAAAARIEEVRGRLWKMLCELHIEASGESQRMTLVITGPNLSLAKILLDAYQRLVQGRQWNLQAHALLRRRPSSSKDRIIDCPGWSDEPAFRVSTLSDKRAASGDRVGPPPRPSLAAYRLIKSHALTETPSGTVGMMLTFRGENAALMMGGELGVHTFHRLQQSKPAGCSVLIEMHAEMPIEYVAPDWLARREYQLAGQPRRWYDAETGLVHDMTDRTRNMKMDREGAWLEKLVEQEMERKIWSALDDRETDDQ